MKLTKEAQKFLNEKIKINSNLIVEQPGHPETPLGFLEDLFYSLDHREMNKLLENLTPSQVPHFILSHTPTVVERVLKMKGFKGKISE